MLKLATAKLELSALSRVPINAPLPHFTNRVGLRGCVGMSWWYWSLDAGLGAGVIVASVGANAPLKEIIGHHVCNEQTSTKSGIKAPVPRHANAPTQTEAVGEVGQGCVNGYT